MAQTEEQQYNHDYHQTHKEERRKYIHAYRAAKRLEIIRLLGGQCANPFGLHDKPFTDIRCLQIDHVHGCGYKERKVEGLTSDRYPRIIKFLKENPHQDKYQLLCANCNWIKKDVNME